MAWWSGIGLFRHTFEDARRVPQYEERVVLVAAPDRATAEAKILREFRQYGAGDAGIEFLQEWCIDEVVDEPWTCPVPANT